MDSVLVASTFPSTEAVSGIRKHQIRDQECPASLDRPIDCDRQGCHRVHPRHDERADDYAVSQHENVVEMLIDQICNRHSEMHYARRKASDWRKYQWN